MRNLSLRLDPTREEFGLRVYRWSLDILEQQILTDDSLFWRVPSRVIKNLYQLFRDKDKDDRVRFFLLSHGSRNRAIFSRCAHIVPSPDEVLSVMKRCVDPSESDVHRKGLLPLTTHTLRLDRRKFHSAIARSLAHSFEEKTDPSEPNDWLYEARCGIWRVVAHARTSSQFQLDIELDVLLGMGDLSLERQLSLHRLFGIAPSAWDLGEPGDEEKLATLLAEYCTYMLGGLSNLLRDLDPAITPDEVRQAEREWMDWLKEVRAARQRLSRTPQ